MIRFLFLLDFVSDLTVLVQLSVHDFILIFKNYLGEGCKGGDE
jgi:hypothetical protein